MNSHLKIANVHRAGERGTTLSELMVAMGVLLIFFLVMASLVSGIQKMFRSGRGQADVLENGRAAMDMIVRDLEQMAAANAAFNNFQLSYAQTTRTFGMNTFYQAGEYFFMTYDTNWHAQAYGIYSRTNAFVNLAGNDAVGRLYRWQASANTPTPLQAAYTNLVAGNYSLVMDGVVHFRIQAISGGVLAAPGVNFPSNSLPTHIEVELGLVDRRTADYIAGSPDQAAWLSYNMNKVYLFRQLVPIKNAHK